MAVLLSLHACHTSCTSFATARSRCFSACGLLRRFHFAFSTRKRDASEPACPRCFSACMLVILVAPVLPLRGRGGAKKGRGEGGGGKRRQTEDRRGAVRRSKLNPLIAVSRLELHPLITVSRVDLDPLIAVSRSEISNQIHRS